MIEYTLISSILDKVCEMTKKTLKYLRDDIRLDPYGIFSKSEHGEPGMKWVIDKIDKWAAWQWANVNINKKNIALLKHVVHISKEDMKYYNLVMFTHTMDFFKEHASLKKSFPKKIKFTSFLNNLLIEDLVTLGNLL
jgi:hypothetical protein